MADKAKNDASVGVQINGIKAVAPSKYIRLGQVLDLTGVSKTTVWRWVREGRFPKPFKLGLNCSAWRLDEVEQWLSSRPRIDAVEA